ncbi:MAG: hypothetical protein ABIP65_07600 [Vicinamibacterales bacterium]
MRNWFRTAALLALASAAALSAAGQKFYRDDPIWRDPETQDASGLKPVTISQQFDFFENTFRTTGDRTDRRAMNVNTLDEVPDSSWFENRIGRETWEIERIVRGPDSGRGPAEGRWTIIAGKSEGISPGMTIKDSKGETYFIKFDPPANPEMASGAEMISTKLFYAFGYHTPENYLATLRRDALDIAPGTRIKGDDGRERLLQGPQVDELLSKAAARPDGTFRVIASKVLSGKPVGHFRYYGTRPDDPNDIYPHEHRRELRGMSVFAAWLNHDDSRSINSLDTLERANGRSVVKHYLLDFGSTLGSGSTQAQTTRAGNEFIWEARPTFVTMLTLGFYVRPWVKVKYPDIPAIGRLESTYFRPESWKPEYPNPAFRNTRPEDRFWAARILSRLSDDAVRATVATASFTDPRATEYLTQTLLERKAKVLRSWLNATNPVVNLELDAAGRLSFRNAAEQAGVGGSAERYTLAWSRFDNTTRAHAAVGSEQTVTTTGAEAPRELLSDGGEFIAVTIRAFRPDQPAWQHPLIAYFKRSDGWKLIGLERDR